jgi:hypothetical protein
MSREMEKRLDEMREKTGGEMDEGMMEEIIRRELDEEMERKMRMMEEMEEMDEGMIYDMPSPDHMGPPPPEGFGEEINMEEIKDKALDFAEEAIEYMKPELEDFPGPEYIEEMGHDMIEEGQIIKEPEDMMPSENIMMPPMPDTSIPEQEYYPSPEDIEPIPQDIIKEEIQNIEETMPTISEQEYIPKVESMPMP